MRPYIAFPGQTIVSAFAPRSVFIVLAGQISAKRDDCGMEFGPGEAFSLAPNIAGCERVSRAVSGGYASLLEVKGWPQGLALRPRPMAGYRHKRRVEA